MAESVAIPADVAEVLERHLLRADGDEDLCLATYATSTGPERTSRLVVNPMLPKDGERFVHGNATVTGEYVLRVAALASQLGHGVVLMHSHPRGSGWQRMSAADADAESGYADLVRQLTGHPLVGVTLAGRDRTWSARTWDGEQPTWAESVRVVGPELVISWNTDLRPAPTPNAGQVRTVSAWGDATQASLARARVLVVGVGSVGLDVAQRLAATGIQHIGLMDHDTVGPENRDRMIGTTAADVEQRRPKVDVAERLVRIAATATHPTVATYPISVCGPAGQQAVLDYDIVFSCVDRPWPRAVLNVVAYADLIPVIDGGIAIDAFPDGGMRSASWRAQTAVPGRPCLMCADQINAQDVTLEQQGLLDDEDYIRRAGRRSLRGSPNVAALSAGVSAAQLSQLVSLVAHPGGFGVPGPLRFSLAAHQLEHLPHSTRAHCPVELSVGEGDRRLNLTRAQVTEVAVRPSTPVVAPSILARLWAWSRASLMRGGNEGATR